MKLCFVARPVLRTEIRFRARLQVSTSRLRVRMQECLGLHRGHWRDAWSVLVWVGSVMSQKLGKDNKVVPESLSACALLTESSFGGCPFKKTGLLMCRRATYRFPPVCTEQFLTHFKNHPRVFR